MAILLVHEVDEADMNDSTNSKGNSVAGFFATFCRITLMFWGFEAFCFAIQFVLGGEKSVFDKDFLYPVELFFVASPFISILLTVATVRRRNS